MAQALQLDDGDAAIFEAQESLLFEPLQALIGVLPRNTGERSDFFLCDLEVTRHVRIKNWIEQRSDRARDAAGGVEHAAVLQRADELADPLIELPDQKPVKRDAVLEQPEERVAVHKRQ